MEHARVSLCPSCTACPEVVIKGDAVRIGEDENIVVLKKDEWNVLVDAIEVRALGYVEGRNLVVERRTAEGHPERYSAPGLAAGPASAASPLA